MLIKVAKKSRLYNRPRSSVNSVECQPNALSTNNVVLYILCWSLDFARIPWLCTSHNFVWQFCLRCQGNTSKPLLRGVCCLNPIASQICEIDHIVRDQWWVLVSKALNLLPQKATGLAELKEHFRTVFVTSVTSLSGTTTAVRWPDVSWSRGTTSKTNRFCGAYRSLMQVTLYKELSNYFQGPSECLALLVDQCLALIGLSDRSGAITPSYILCVSCGSLQLTFPPSSPASRSCKRWSLQLFNMFTCVHISNTTNTY